MRPVHKELFLIFHGRFPGEKAAAVFAAKNAEAFADAGVSVTFLAPRRLGRSRNTPAEFYGVKNNFKVVYLPTIDLLFLPFFKRLAFAASYIVFSKMVLLYLLFFAKKDAVVYSNEALPLLFASLRFPNTVYEVHDFPRNTRFYKTLFRRVRFAVVTNRWKQGRIAELFDVPAERLFYEPNAVDVESFSGAGNGVLLRKSYDIPEETFLIGYAGSLRTMDMEKGVGTLFSAMKLLGPDFKALIIGGSKEDADYYKRMASGMGIERKLIFTGWVKHSSVPQYLKMCDVLISPFPKNDHYNFYMSPMKIFEYMASGVPIVASDLNSIREIIDDASAFLVEPENAEALAEGINRAVTDRTESRRRAVRALEIAGDHTWKKRTERIIGRLSTL
ncbi:MAG: glycosyltransferase family 4 protein [Candidatus Sungbacteria bacterium]|nr:glycosyltransferase family 4 protein [Candidatus Sungbacteria bacterium]